MSTPAVAFAGVSRHYGPVRAVDDVSFEIEEGEFFAMLGPSGSGKTTSLRLIAGFERPTKGRVLIEGRDVSGVPPYERDVNTVFQDYALFPHMTVGENVEYALTIQRVPAAERRRRAAEALEMVKLAGMESRRPAQLSGGQRQRVALARALIARPKVLLLDEPLGALDLKLREAMQVELKALQRQIGITFVFVTHDQGEALGMSDRLAVFHNGRIEQIGAPSDVYDHPETEFVAGFVGASNVLKGEAARRVIGRDQAFSIRPEKIRVLEAGATPPDGAAVARGRVASVLFLGPVTRYVVELEGGGELQVTEQNLLRSGRAVVEAQGRDVLLAWDAAETRPLRAETGAAA